MSTFTNFLVAPHLDQNIAQPEVPLNETMDIFDAAICGQLIVPMTIDTTYVLKNTNTDDSLNYPYEWHHAILILNVSNTAQTELHLPDTYKMKYVVENNTGQNILFKTVTGTGVTITTGTTVQVYSDGTNIVSIA